ncbi:uncharacterized protein [Clytia hemisphaerica]|uniref:uncharacterized protein isoform X2 n=1 Tax=Clytia hemisphaerica TaxID=252671 RepID=UPI0034D42628
MDVKQEVMEKVEVKDEEFPQDHLDQPSKRKNIDDTEPIKQEDGGDDNFDLMTGTMNKRMRNGFKKLCSAIDALDLKRKEKDALMAELEAGHLTVDYISQMMLHEKEKQIAEKQKKKERLQAELERLK